ncbi:RrF2 family transcriptional regulator [Reinekea thalattae]|uniref:Rrf2 family transcriptional regulator n=1 Tax=Reinekea thalattae TaxID=2593301 RepID=A0A5C8Z7I3_9GAMM|nr:Rrf2 family transcriptional regulator [Reinekea thalattae]TXR53274.1 Rrf2 family transcriptional regulator [Reinekea thalattae]
MKINNFTNYAYRILIVLGLNKDKTVPLSEIAALYDISLNHLKKVSARLVEHGYVETERGRSGGLKIAKPTVDIGLGDVFKIAQTETAFIDCSMKDSSSVLQASVSELQLVFEKALSHFIAVLNQYTLADLMIDRRLQSSLMVSSTV